MKFSYNLINAVIFRSVGVFSVCFIGRDFFDYSSFLWWHWVLVAVGILLCLFLLFLIVRAYYRYLRKKNEGPRYLLIMGLSTIVNTNMDLEELEKRYDPRIVSRFIGNYTCRRFLGNDIRQLKQFAPK